ncbi:DUF5684 domain-containing protein [Pseudoclavibacter terrae]|uniref:DUF5684 domain-containing protein n=1 Tax=Pseudoclavibacter terrae TaxID=1530195 RepID=UPI001AD7B46C|nr:DUF5684 domain-containing protein [Pseudoclavibacter terrae]
MLTLENSTQMDSWQWEALSPGGTAGGFIGWILLIAALWPVFRKAGYPGWGAIIPIYNIYILVKIAGYHGATVLLYLIPLVNVVFSIFVAMRIGKAFGRGGLFSFFLLWLFSLIGYFIVGYGSSQYRGPGGRAIAA